MRVSVWVDAWQQQCCGAEFRVSSTVRWDVLRTQGVDALVTTLLGPNWGAKVRLREDHHGGADDDPAAGEELAGVVRSILVVTCDRWHRAGPGEPPGGIWVPIIGSGRVREVEFADPWEPESPSDESPDPEDSLRWVVDPPPWWFEGWIVDVDVHGSA